MQGDRAAHAVSSPPIMNLETLLKERDAWRAAGRKVVLTNGCFDLLHLGHLALLEAARSHGDILIVAINSDRSVMEIKGPSRPLIPEGERAEVLSSLESVDRVVSYDEPTPLRLIEALVPDVLVKGADWGEDSVVGRSVVEGAGGEVVRIGLIPGRSTTSLVKRLRRP